MIRQIRSGVACDDTDKGEPLDAPILAGSQFTASSREKVGGDGAVSYVRCSSSMT